MKATITLICETRDELRAISSVLIDATNLIAMKGGEGSKNFTPPPPAPEPTEVPEVAFAGDAESPTESEKFFLMRDGQRVEVSADEYAAWRAENSPAKSSSEKAPRKRRTKAEIAADVEKAASQPTTEAPALPIPPTISVAAAEREVSYETDLRPLLSLIGSRQSMAVVAELAKEWDVPPGEKGRNFKLLANNPTELARVIKLAEAYCVEHGFMDGE